MLKGVQEPKYYLGGDVQTLNEHWQKQGATLGLSAQTYIENITEKFQTMLKTNFKTEDTPMAEGDHPELDESDFCTPLQHAQFRALVGSANWLWAVVNDRVIETALGYFLAPLGTMALGVTLLGETLTPLKRVSIGFAGVAVAVLTVSYGRMPWVALLLAGSWSWYGLTKRRVPLDPIESLASELFVLALPALGLVAVGWFRADGIPSQATGADWVFLFGTGAITAIPLLMFAFAAQRVPFTVLGPANYLVPLINFLLGWLAFGEDLPRSRVVGFALVWVALVLVTADMVRNRSSTEHRVPVPIR